MAHELRLAAVALQFLTRVPVRFGAFDPQWLQDCARHFPLVGAGVGLFGAAVLLAAAALWPPAVAVGLAMAATVWLTGGFHEDGLADTCDGLGGAVSRERALV
ncbi:MAG: adenosylcobinamide-GDP ribazoletransferase, partial [Burkholderiales bacterium PBB5]